MIIATIYVFGINASGEPDIWSTDMNTSQENIDNGECFERAKQLAREDDFEPLMAVDEFDLDHFLIPRLEALGKLPPAAG